MNEVQNPTPVQICQYINTILDMSIQFFTECCNVCTCGCHSACMFPDISKYQSCAYDLVCVLQQPKITLSTQDSCSAYSIQLEQLLVGYKNQFCVSTTISTNSTIQPSSTTESFLDVVQKNAPAVAGTVGGIGAITLLIQPPTPLITPQGIPPGNPIPGTPGIIFYHFKNSIKY